jgi:hypothetical protein
MQRRPACLCMLCDNLRSSTYGGAGMYAALWLSVCERTGRCPGGRGLVADYAAAVRKARMQQVMQAVASS